MRTPSAARSHTGFWTSESLRGRLGEEAHHSRAPTPGLSVGELPTWGVRRVLQAGGWAAFAAAFQEVGRLVHVLKQTNTSSLLHLENQAEEKEELRLLLLFH